MHGEPFSLELTIGPRGPHGDGDFWSWEPDVVIAGYGATRNLSEVPDLSSDLSDSVRGCVSLFHAMSKLQYADLILKKSARSKEARLGAEYFRELVQLVFEDELRLDKAKAGSARFAIGGSAVDALELPDGFRSSVAWMADLCVRWATLATRSRRKKPQSVRDMAGIVLIDELDLHLHPSLQRSIVPHLRRALPQLQFVVTSHSPLVLASFDRRELIPLDQAEQDGIRELDRQILGFSPDQVYEWLLGTPPSSAALDAEIASAARTDRRRDLAQMLLQDSETDPEHAKQRLSRIRSMLGKLK